MYKNSSNKEYKANSTNDASQNISKSNSSSRFYIPIKSKYQLKMENSHQKRDMCRRIPLALRPTRTFDAHIPPKKKFFGNACPLSSKLNLQYSKTGHTTFESKVCWSKYSLSERYYQCC